MRLRFRIFAVTAALLASHAVAQLPAPEVLVGFAKIDITPDVPIRLTGYAARKAETSQIETRLYARAIAIGSDQQKPVVLIAVETIEITAELSDSVAAALKQTHGLDRSQVAICVTHIHTGPATTGRLTSFLFGADLPADEVARIADYTQTLTAKIERVAVDALANRQPSYLSWGQGTVDFATYRRKIIAGKWAGWGANRRGPADHSLPVLRATDARGNVRGVLASYACHCTTLAAAHNFVHSDWAGDAAARIEANHEGAVALVTIGCGADANPFPSGTVEEISRHGSAVADEVERLLGSRLQPLGAVTEARFQQVELPLESRVTRDELVAHRDSGSPAAEFTASKWLARLEAGETMPATVNCPVQIWSFDAELAMIHLGGEVVSEYSLRLKRELDEQRIWVAAYANSVPGYIPSQRMFAEGGYEVDRSTDLYGLPTQFSSAVEDTLIAAVHELVPESFDRQRP